MHHICPISTKRIDTHLVRLISFQVVLLTLIFLWTDELMVVMILLLDFITRALRLTQLSPFYLIAKSLLYFLNLPPKLSDEAPKRFALYLGLFISAILLLSLFTGFGYFAHLIASILLLCALMESLFDFCIGCRLYYAIQFINP